MKFKNDYDYSDLITLVVLIFSIPALSFIGWQMLSQPLSFIDELILLIIFVGIVVEVFVMKEILVEG